MEKNIPHQYIEINPYNKEASFLAMNPRGLVPTLAVPVGEKGKPLYESTIICEYLDEAFEGGRLLPEDAYERARARLWIDHVCTRIIPAFYKLLQHTPDKAYSIDQAREEFHSHIRALTKEMDSSGPWFLGKTFSLVDIMLAPWAKRLWLIDHYKYGGVGIPEDGDEVWGRWREWFEAVVERPSVTETWSDDDQYVGAYKRYADDTTNSLVGQATRKGGKLP